jgi:hypothetical protein
MLNSSLNVDSLKRIPLASRFAIPSAPMTGAWIGSAAVPAISMFDPKTETIRHYDLGATRGNLVGNRGEQLLTPRRLWGADFFGAAGAGAAFGRLAVRLIRS